jgi:hypothetical protein
MKYLLTVITFLTVLSGQGQNSHSLNFEAANSLYVSSVNQLLKKGYDVKGVIIRRDWGGISFGEYELIGTGVDSVFMDCYLVGNDVGFYLSEGGFTITKRSYKDKKAVSELLSDKYKSLPKGTFGGIKYQLFRSFFTPSTQREAIGFSASYDFNIEFLDETRIANIEGKPFDRKSLIMIVYTRSK